MTSVLITVLLLAPGCGEEAPPQPTAEELAAKAKATAEASRTVSSPYIVSVKTITTL